MSGAFIAKKVNFGLSKAASKAGFPVKLFRPDNYDNPLDERNYRVSLVVAWSVDSSFSKNPVDELDHYKIFASNDNFQLGDLILAEDQGKTFVITELEPMRVPAGILVNDRMSVLRTILQPTENVKTKLVHYYTDLPCAVKFKGAAGSTNGLTPVSSMKGGQSQIEVWTWVPADSIKMTDVIEVNGNKYSITSCQSTSKGTKISAISQVVGK